MRIGSLCTGYGGLDMAVRSVFGGHLAWVSDIEPGPTKLLEHHHPSVPNLGDLKVIDWATVEPVDVFTAGYPCQPFSNAGLRKGTDDPRHIWPYIAYGIDRLRPRIVVLENVGAHFKRGFRVVAADLAALGYRVAWTLLRASDVGAAHRRERLFIVAVAEDANLESWGERGSAAPGQEAGGWSRPDTGGRGVRADALTRLGTPRASDGFTNQLRNPANIAHHKSRLEDQIALLLPTPPAVSYGNNRGGAAGRVGKVRPSLEGIVKTVVADEFDWQEYEHAIRRWESALGRPAPYPAASGPRGGVKVSPAFGEWLMGLPAGWISEVPGLPINEQLKLVGNGVVPQQAEAAIRYLMTALQRNEEMMTTQDTSSFFITHQARDVPRDQHGRYKLPGPDGLETSWTRATTFAATLAEQYGLRIWKERQVVWGLSRRPDLITMASTIVGPEDKKALGEIVTEAHIAAGTDAKANRGTAIHLACAAAEAGAFERVPEELRPHVAGYFKAMRDGGLEILPQYVERTGIVKQYGVAGTLDNLVRCPDGKVRVADKKTGRMDYSDTEFTVQMALYAHFDALFNYGTNSYEPMPEVATDYAILAHIDPETGHTELLRINIEWGWVWARTCAEVRDIRGTKHVITPYIADGMDSRAMTPAQETRQPIAVPAPVSPAPQSVVFAPGTPGIEQINPATYPGISPLGQVIADMANAHLRREHDGTFTMNGQSVGPPAEQPGPDGMTEEQRYFAFWAQSDEDGEQTVNGVPLSEYGKPTANNATCGECGFGIVVGDHSQSDCDANKAAAAAGQGTPTPFTQRVDLEAAAREAQQPNATPQSVMAAAGAPVYEIAGQTDVTVEELTSPAVVLGDPDALVAAIDGLKGGKAAVQNVARRLMAKLGIKEGDPGSIKLNQYKIKVARACVDLAHKHGVSIPGAKDDQPDLGVPSGPAPTGDAPTSSAGASAPKKAQGDAGAAEVPGAQAPDPAREEKLRTAVRSIMACGSIEQLQKVHAHYSGTSLGWTDEMQTAARTRALELEQSGDESPLTPLEMIQGATSRETLSKAWEKATQGGTDMAGWTEELNAAALAKQTELSGGGS